MDYSNIVGVEMCKSKKNFYSMVIGSAKDLNTAAILMQKSVIEMGKFIKLFGGSKYNGLWISWLRGFIR